MQDLWAADGDLQEAAGCPSFAVSRIKTQDSAGGRRTPTPISERRRAETTARCSMDGDSEKNGKTEEAALITVADGTAGR